MSVRDARSIKKAIKIWDRSLAEDPLAHESHREKATLFFELYELTKKSKYLNDALECYNKAIELCPNNVLYIIRRAKIYVLIDKNKARLDLEKVKTTDLGTNRLTIMYVNNFISQLESQLTAD